MGLVKKDPFKDLLFLQDRMSRIFDEALGRYKWGGAPAPNGAWFPPVDVFETEESIVLKAELPGMEAKAVSVEVEENLITLKGERKFEKKLAQDNCHRMERFYGVFERVFSLPNSVDKSSIKANFKDGVLEIIVPKIFSARPKPIKIKVE